MLRAWRESWTWAPTTYRIKLRRLKAFFRFTAERGWLEESPAASLRLPKVDPPATMPLSRAEVRELVRAAGDHPWEQALVVLMRYSRLAIRDAATLPRDAPDGNTLTLRRAKTGELVLCELPGLVADALERIACPGRAHSFRTGTSRPQSVTNYWQSRLHKIAVTAHVPAFTSHRLRDTFAVEPFLRRVAMQDLSTLLEHSSIRTTERYCAPWNRSRRNRLPAIVRDANDGDELLRELAGRSIETNARAITSSPCKRPGQATRSQPATERLWMARHLI